MNLELELFWGIDIGDVDFYLVVIGRKVYWGIKIVGINGVRGNVVVCIYFNKGFYRGL